MPIGLQLIATDWGYVTFWTVFGVVIAALPHVVFAVSPMEVQRAPGRAVLIMMSRTL